MKSRICLPELQYAGSFFNNEQIIDGTRRLGFSYGPKSRKSLAQAWLIPDSSRIFIVFRQCSFRIFPDQTLFDLNGSFRLKKSPRFVNES